MRWLRVGRWVERQNQRVDGGCVVLCVQQVFHDARYRVAIEMPASGHRSFNIANEYDLRRSLRHAEAWLDEHSGADGIFQVEPFLDSEAYARWCDHGLPALRRQPIAPASPTGRAES